MKVRYTGPFGLLVVDGIEIPQGGEAELTEEQFARVAQRGVEVVEAPQGAGRAFRTLRDTNPTTGDEGGAAAKEV